MASTGEEGKFLSKYVNTLNLLWHAGVLFVIFHVIQFAEVKFPGFAAMSRAMEKRPGAVSFIFLAIFSLCKKYLSFLLISYSQSNAHPFYL